jgi:hypothetical protein
MTGGRMMWGGWRGPDTAEVGDGLELWLTPGVRLP